MIYAGWKSVFQPAFFVLFTIFVRFVEKDESISDNKWKWIE